MIAGIAAVVLGILALVGVGEPLILVLVALLTVGGAQLLTGIAQSGRMGTLLKSI